MFARRKNTQCVGPTGVPYSMCRLFNDTVLNFVNYRASSQRRKPLVEFTESLMQCTLTIFVIQGAFYAAGLLAVEQTSFLLSDRWCRLFCNGQPCSIPRNNKLCIIGYHCAPFMRVEPKLGVCLTIESELRWIVGLTLRPFYPKGNKSRHLFHLPTSMHNSLFVNNMYVTLLSSTCFEH